MKSYLLLAIPLTIVLYRIIGTPSLYLDEFPNRLIKLDENITYIDNDFYNDSSCWNNDDPLNLLGLMNVIRLPYFDKHLKNLQKKLHINKINVLDVGCGGGLLTEPLSTLGYNMTGIDMHPGVIKTAQEHAKQQNLTINYQIIMHINYHLKIILFML